MHSSKNTMVAILLLGVSYGVYQVMTAPVTPLDTEAKTALASNGDETSAAPVSSLNTNDSALSLSSPEKTPAPTANNSPATFTAPNFNSNPTPTPNAPSLPELKTPPSQPGGFSSQPNDYAVTPPNTAGFSASNPSTQDSAVPRQDMATNPSGSMDTQFQQFTQNNTQSISTSESTYPSTNLAPLNRNNRSNETVNGQGGNTFVATPAARESYATTPAPFPQPSMPLAQVWDQVQRHVNNGEFRTALQTLTPYSQASGLSSQEQEDLYVWLDTLAVKVIYSSEHHFADRPYVITKSDTLETLSNAWQVPMNLIYNVNKEKIVDPLVLETGVEIKQVTGPFEAIINRTNQELTLYVSGMYAGRFSYQAASLTMSPGKYQIQAKQKDDNNQGRFAMTLDSGLVLCASNPANTNSVQFSDEDSRNLYGILSEGSTVIIR
ncbi:MAG: hypothetical protein R3C03_18085 [Pirellulaceae bacterium]